MPVTGFPVRHLLLQLALGNTHISPVAISFHPDYTSRCYESSAFQRFCCSRTHHLRRYVSAGPFISVSFSAFGFFFAKGTYSLHKHLVDIVVRIRHLPLLMYPHYAPFPKDHRSNFIITMLPQYICLSAWQMLTNLSLLNQQTTYRYQTSTIIRLQNMYMIRVSLIRLLISLIFLQYVITSTRMCVPIHILFYFTIDTHRTTEGICICKILMLSPLFKSVFCHIVDIYTPGQFLPE